jgi:hypothetical protein
VLVVVVVMMTTTMMTINGLANSLVGFKTQWISCDFPFMVLRTAVINWAVCSVDSRICQRPRYVEVTPLYLPV